MIKLKSPTLLLIIFCFFFDIAFSQLPGIGWQRTLGGTKYDYLMAMNNTTDGGVIVCGYSNSGLTGNKTEASFGLDDYWVIKLNATGATDWQNTIGGTQTDQAFTVIQTSDGGYLVGGYSNSDVNGEKTVARYGGYDYWIIKLNSTGGIVWQKDYGGSGTDNLKSIVQTTDGGFLLSGKSNSGISGIKTEATYGNYDYWIIKTDNSGNILWQKTIGGSTDDELTCAIQLTDGGYLLGGQSFSGISGLKTEVNLGLRDYWVVKLNSTGSIIWQNTIGGNDYDYLNSIDETTDGGSIIGGYSESGISGDKTESNMGTTDYWILKLNSTGDIEWQNTIGGSSNDYLDGVLQTSDGGFIASGESTSDISFDKSQDAYSADYWIVKMDATGNIIWNKDIRGSYNDSRPLITEQPGGYLVGGYSTSSLIYDKTNYNIGETDFWVLQLLTCSTEICNVNDDDCDGLVDDLDPDVADQHFYFADLDEDGYGDNLNDTLICFLPMGYMTNNLDCDDSQFNINPLGFETDNGIDENCDGLIDNISNFYLQSQFVELSINTCGAYISEETPPIGFHPYYVIGHPLTLGIIADRDMDGWDAGTPNFCGDYSMPAVELEGWTFQIDTLIYSNGMDDCYYNQITGSNTHYIEDDGEISAEWSGTIPSQNINFRQITNLADSNLYFITTVTITNENTYDLTDLYYTRLIDPDQEAYQTDEYKTFNEIISNPPIGDIALIKGEGLEYGCYLGLGSKNSNARVSYSSNFNLSKKPSNMYAGLDGSFITGSVTNDYTVAITFHIPTIPAEDSIQLAFAYIFSDEVVDEAINKTDLACLVIPELCNTLDDNCNGLIDDGITETISISAAGPTTFCQGGSVVLSAIYSGATVQWKKDGVNIAGATSANYTVTKKGNYTCVTTSPCGTATSSIINVTVNKNPAASISAAGATTFCAGGSVTLTEVPSGGCTYQWYKGASLIAGATTVNYIATTTGNYKCRVTKTATGCYKNSNPIAVSVPCREDEINSNENNSFALFPNPANDKLNIQINSQLLSPSSYLLTITDLQGREIYTTHLNSPTIEINISDFASGMYFVKVIPIAIGRGEEMIEKFIKN